MSAFAAGRAVYSTTPSCFCPRPGVNAFDRLSRGAHGLGRAGACSALELRARWRRRRRRRSPSRTLTRRPPRRCAPVLALRRRHSSRDDDEAARRDDAARVSRIDAPPAVRLPFSPRYLPRSRPPPPVLSPPPGTRGSSVRCASATRASPPPRAPRSRRRPGTILAARSRRTRRTSALASCGGTSRASRTSARASTRPFARASRVASASTPAGGTSRSTPRDASSCRTRAIPRPPSRNALFFAPSSRARRRSRARGGATPRSSLRCGSTAWIAPRPTSATTPRAASGARRRRSPPTRSSSSSPPRTSGATSARWSAES